MDSPPTIPSRGLNVRPASSAPPGIAISTRTPRCVTSRTAAAQATLCLYLSIDKAESLAETLAMHYGAECPAAVVYHASWPDEIVVRGTLRDIGAKTASAGIARTALLMVGRALARPYAHQSKLYDENFSHAYR
jgi:precorrin-4/cobalt-precorrin-4 C11-methyltransferase